MENKLAAETHGSMTRCVICTKMTAAIHWHHTVPRSLGGELSLQIPLCGDCHTNLHSHASGIVASIRGNKKQLKKYWANPADEQRAKIWLQVLVDSMLCPQISVGDKQHLLPMLKVDATTRQGLDLLKKDLPGITNIEQTLLFCINYTLSQRGYKNETSKSGQTKSHGKSSSRSSHLW